MSETKLVERLREAAGLMDQGFPGGTDWGGLYREAADALDRAGAARPAAPAAIVQMPMEDGPGYRWLAFASADEADKFAKIHYPEALLFRILKWDWHDQEPSP